MSKPPAVAVWCRVATLPLMRQAHKHTMKGWLILWNLWRNYRNKRGEAKAAYIKACNEWAETRTAENIKGDFEKWKALCERKADCMRLGVII